MIRRTPSLLALAVWVAVAACAGPGARTETTETTTSGPSTSAATSTSTTTTTVAGGTSTTAASAASTTVAGATTTSAPATIAPSTTSSSTTTTTLAPLVGLAVEVLSEAAAYPTFITSLPDDDRLFVVERSGTIRILGNDDGFSAEPFLDITDRVGASSGIEVGLLGLAFHPGYATNGRFFVYYTDRENEPVLSEFAVTADPDRGDAASERVLIDVDKDGLRHNAGMLQFGPDGYLYVSVGDGGSYPVNPQNPDTLLGGILRIDVDRGDPYAIPADNPYADGGGRGEVWAIGLRNPWRFWIDAAEGLIYIGDVGQADVEEIDVVPLGPGGYNFGWPLMEGNECWEPATGCDPASFTAPYATYDHAAGTCSVTGGVVYRGSAIPELVGDYFFADWCAGWVRTLRYEEGGTARPITWRGDLEAVGQVTAFGVDGGGEVLVVTSGGLVARIVPIR